MLLHLFTKMRGNACCYLKYMMKWPIPVFLKLDLLQEILKCAVSIKSQSIAEIIRNKYSLNKNKSVNLEI